MIKILKPGKSKIAICSKCECEFSYEKEDVKFGGQRDEYCYVVCPCCRNSVIVPFY